MHNEIDVKQVLNSLPDPDSIRRRLTQNAREARLLRQLLKLSVRAVAVKEGESALTPAQAA